MKTGFVWKFTCILISICFVISCSSGGGDSTTPTSTSGTTVSGIASKGIISGGTVKVYAIKDNGLEGQLLGSGTTDADGIFHADIGNYDGPVLIEVTGGRYVDEATGTVTDFNDTMRAALPSISDDTEVAVTPLTEIAVRIAEAGGGFDTVKIEDANELISQLIGADIIATLPADCDDANTFGNASQDEQNYAFFLAAISQLSETSGQDIDDIIEYLEEDIADLELDEIGLSMTTAIDAFLNSDENNTGTSDASNLVDTIVAIVNNGLEPTGDLVDAKTYLSNFLLDPTTINYDTLMDYLETFVPDSAEAYLFKAMATLMDIYQNSATEFLTDNGLHLDVLDPETFDGDAFFADILALAAFENDIIALTEELENRLQDVYDDLGYAEGAKTTISLSGIGTTYFDDVDVKIMKAIASAGKVICMYLQSLDLTVTDWEITPTLGSEKVDARDLIRIDEQLTQDQQSEFLANNLDFLTYADLNKLGMVKAAVIQAASDLQDVVDALATLGSAGREARMENAFNLDSNLDFYRIKALSEETMPSIIEAIDNPNTPIITVYDEETGAYLFLNEEDGYTYRKTTRAIYLKELSPAVVDPITINDLLLPSDSLRDLFDLTADPYVETGSPALYLQNIEEIDWEDPIESFNLPSAAITIDGNAADWEDVPVLQFIGGLTVKIAAGHNNTYYVYLQHPDRFNDTGDECYITIGNYWELWDFETPVGDEWFEANMSISNWGSGVNSWAVESGSMAPTYIDLPPEKQKVIQIGGMPVGLEVEFDQLDRLLGDGYINWVAFSWNTDGFYNSFRKKIKLYP